MSFDLTGKVVLITGGTRGLGAAMARGFAAAGADLIVSSRKAEACEAMAAEIRGMGRRAVGIACNVGRMGRVRADRRAGQQCRDVAGGPVQCGDQ